MMAKQFTSVADMKRNLKPGDKVITTMHQAFAGHDENKKVIYKDETKPVAEVSIVKSTQFAIRREKGDSWMEFPKASRVRFDGSKVTILTPDLRQFPGGYLNDEAEAKLPLIPLLTYEFVD
jgi:hypothetical protein